MLCFEHHFLRHRLSHKAYIFRTYPASEDLKSSMPDSLTLYWVTSRYQLYQRSSTLPMYSQLTLSHREVRHRNAETFIVHPISYCHPLECLARPCMVKWYQQQVNESWPLKRQEICANRKLSGQNAWILQWYSGSLFNRYIVNCTAEIQAKKSPGPKRSLRCLGVAVYIVWSFLMPEYMLLYNLSKNFSSGVLVKPKNKLRL